MSNIILTSPDKLDRLSSCFGYFRSLNKVRGRATATEASTQLSLMKAHVLGRYIRYA